MGSYTIRSGDTLSALAQRNHTTVQDLMRLNPQIRNANLIYSGAKLNLPGSKDEFVPAKPGANRTSGAGGAAGPMTSATGKGNGQAAFDNARSVMGHNICELKQNGPLARYLDKWPGNNVCCANFVSSCLEKSGLINHSEHNDNVKGLADNLAKDPRWAKTDLKNAKPGDVVCFNVPGEGSYSHVEMFAGWKNGAPQFIGSNNANSDGSQKITQGPANYPIAAIYQYHG